MAKGINPADLVPWVGMALAGVGAIATAVVKLVIVSKQLEMQKQQMEFAREQWRSMPRIPPANLQPVMPPQVQPVAAPFIQAVPAVPANPLS